MTALPDFAPAHVMVLGLVVSWSPARGCYHRRCGKVAVVVRLEALACVAIATRWGRDYERIQRLAETPEAAARALEERLAVVAWPQWPGPLPAAPAAVGDGSRP